MHNLVLIVGGPESGKTTLLEWLIERHRQRGHVFCIRDVMGHWSRRRRPGIYVFEGEDPEAWARHLIALSWRLRCGVTGVADEAWDLFPAGSPPPREAALWSIVRTGRQPKYAGSWRRLYPVGLMLATQRPKDLDVGFRNVVRRLYVGHVSGPTDLDWLGEVCQVRTLEPPARREALARLGSIPVRKFLALDVQ